MKKHRFVTFQNRALSTIVRPKRKEVTGDWRRSISCIICKFMESNESDDVGYYILRTHKKYVA
jgi:hypothetical protein